MLNYTFLNKIRIHENKKKERRERKKEKKKEGRSERWGEGKLFIE